MRQGGVFGQGAGSFKEFKNKAAEDRQDRKKPRRIGKAPQKSRGALGRLSPAWPGRRPGQRPRIGRQRAAAFLGSSSEKNRD